MTMLNITLADRQILDVTRDEAVAMGVPESDIAKAENNSVAPKSTAVTPEIFFIHLSEFARGIAAAKDLAAVRKAAQNFTANTGGSSPASEVT